MQKKNKFVIIPRDRIFIIEPKEIIKTLFATKKPKGKKK